MTALIACASHQHNGPQWMRQSQQIQLMNEWKIIPYCDNKQTNALMPRQLDLLFKFEWSQIDAIL